MPGTCWRVKGYHTSQSALVCYGGAGFDPELTKLAGSERLLLVDLARLYHR